MGPKGSVQEQLGTSGEGINACGTESQCVNIHTHKYLLKLVQWKVSILSVSDTTCVCSFQSAHTRTQPSYILGQLFSVCVLCVYSDSDSDSDPNTHEHSLTGNTTDKCCALTNLMSAWRSFQILRCLQTETTNCQRTHSSIPSFTEH